MDGAQREREREREREQTNGMLFSLLATPLDGDTVLRDHLHGGCCIVHVARKALDCT